MNIIGTESNQAILKKMGIRIKQKRIAFSLTQKELSQRTGISLRTITNIENGENTSFDNIISLLKALKSIDNLDLLIPEAKIDPLALLNLQGQRKRASKAKTNTNWKWGDEK
jgi:transcriptional regulator with XRE-family HTH domain